MGSYVCSCLNSDFEYNHSPFSLNDDSLNNPSLPEDYTTVIYVALKAINNIPDSIDCIGTGGPYVELRMTNLDPIMGSQLQRSSYIPHHMYCQWVSFITYKDEHKH